MKKTLVAWFVVLSMLVHPSAHAGYAQLKPPSGWSQGMGAAVPGTAGVFNFGNAANGAAYRGGTVLSNASLNVGGTLVTMPVAMRYAANAGAVASTFSFNNPYLFAALAVGSVVMQHYASEGLTVKDGVWKKAGSATFNYYEQSGSFGRHSSQAEAGQAFAAGRSAPPYAVFQFRSCSGDLDGAVCTLGLENDPSYRENFTVRKVQSGGSSAERNAVLYDFTPLHSKAMPIGLPEMLPVDLPIKLPVINPDPNILPQPEPAPDLVPRPMWVPTGDPVKNPNPERDAAGNPLPLPNGEPNPNAKPDTWTQPGVKVTPSPTPSNPWQVDVVSDPKTGTTSQPNVAPETKAPTEKPEQDNSFNDTPLPPIPDLYTRKYPDGIVGVWNSKIAEIKETPLFALGKNLMPTLPTAGTCPHWLVPLDFGKLGQFGSGDVSPPCWVWDFGKVVIVVSSLLLARRLIFGG